MSGGSFNYLCHRDIEEMLTWSDDDLDGMIDELRHRGYDKAADDSEAFKQRITELRNTIAQMECEIASLRDVWRAVEWRCSSDIGDAELEREVQRYCREVESDD